ncbi:mitochondrial 54S ribosomal protein YmL15 [Maudiozyma humilis]|uniref:Mitochondrial 54S ribosomal protein YmL15 n=1 Tax=Maudiozyma humilis TaxID=51915 RepID=A0AAV5S4D8_MAUHU|nr:mitochondrial 54S ribosomal protein YmL15 [Kazachstania humilis]
MFPRLVAREVRARVSVPGSRSIAILNKGARIRGAKRDPASYMKNASGLQYSAAKAPECQDKVRNAFKFADYGVQLSDSLILQCLTHKSFAHGSVPYNEKLQLLGTQFLKLRATLFSLHEGGNAANASTGNINGLDFAALGSPRSKTLVSRRNIGQTVKRADIDDVVFWKMRDVEKGGKYNGEDTVLSSVLSALVGAILTTNGPEVAATYVDKFLLGEGSSLSLVKDI